MFGSEVRWGCEGGHGSRREGDDRNDGKYIGEQEGDTYLFLIPTSQHSLVVLLIEFFS